MFSILPFFKTKIIWDNLTMKVHSLYFLLWQNCNISLNELIGLAKDYVQGQDFAYK